MIATILSLILAALLFFIPLDLTQAANLTFPIQLMSGLLLLALPLTFSSAWSSLQKGEQNLTPRLIEVFSRDKRIHLTALILIAFPLISVVLSWWLQYSIEINKIALLMGWTVLFGISLDATFDLLKRITQYLNPFKATELFAEKAKENIRANRLDLVIDSIDALSEVSLRALERSNTSLATQGILELRDVGDTFLKSAKSFANLSQDLQTLEEKQIDKVSYTLFYLLGRLEMINQKAAEKKLEPVVSQNLTALGKLAISAAKFDLTLSPAPIQTLGRSAILALQNKLKESGIKAELVLVEVARSIIREADFAYNDLKSPFLAILDNLDILSKEMFSLDKNIRIQILTQPLQQVREILNDPKIKDHQDTPLLQQEADRLLAEYAALQAVLSARPMIPSVNE